MPPASTSPSGSTHVARDYPPDASNGQAARIVIADDSLLLREGLVRLLSEAGFQVMGQAGDAEDLVRKVGAHRPDVALVDVRMPPTYTDDGLRAALEIRRRLPQVGVLVLSEYLEEGCAQELFADGAGGLGYLLKQRVIDLERFVDAVRRVGEGGSVLDPEVVSRLLRRRSGGATAVDELTDREKETLALMAEGRSNQGIAEELVVTERTVEKHVRSIFDKLELSPEPREHRRVLAVLRYLREREQAEATSAAPLGHRWERRPLSATASPTVLRL